MSAFAAEPKGKTKRIYASQISEYAEGILACLSSFRFGIVFLCLRSEKLHGWFGGTGFSGTISDFAKFGMPAAVTAATWPLELWL
jgi:hypothetical protein